MDAIYPWQAPQTLEGSDVWKDLTQKIDLKQGGLTQLQRWVKAKQSSIDKLIKQTIKPL